MKQKTITIAQTNFRSEKLCRIVIEAFVAVLLIVWLHTGISKLLDYHSFRIQMEQSPIFHNYASVVTLSGPILELILATLLIFKKSRLYGMIGSFFLMCFFTWYVLWLMINIPKLPCSCGGIVSFLNWPQHLALNIILTLISGIGVFLLFKLRKSSRQ